MRRSLIAVVALAVTLSAISAAFAAESVTTATKAPSEKYDESYTTCGVGLDTTFIIGAITMNGLGFPKLSIGMSTEGIDIRKFTNTPSLWMVQETERRIKTETGLSGDELNAKVAEAVSPNQFSYIQFGTVDVTNPLIGVGTLIPLKKSITNKAFFDLGVNWPNLVNVGIIFVF